jgi:hypothetical protein
MPLVSAQMTGVNAVTAALHAKSPSGRAQATAEVGYSAPYAIYVHENLAASHLCPVDTGFLVNSAFIVIK